MEALGREFNVVPVGAGAWVSLRHAAGLTLVCVGANTETFTLNQATDSAGSGAKALAVLEHYYYSSASVGQTAWAESTAPTSTSVVTTTTAQPVAVIHVSANSLDDTFSHVRVAASASGTVFAILHDLNMQRSPEYLPIPVSNA
jgi:hypothetical protein